jgi:malate dehydrogenase (oxaloacetate-decarboxylating)
MREDKLMRTVRCRNNQKLGTLGHLLIAIADQGGDIGEIRLVQETHQAVIRDITIYLDNEEQLERVLAAIATNSGTRILALRDEVLELHQKGKIAIRSRYTIDSLYTLRRVYTPAVASVCMKIAADPSLARQYTAIITDGSAVLGLGNIGAVAGMPVMEGKAMLVTFSVRQSGQVLRQRSPQWDTLAPDRSVRADFAKLNSEYS